MVRGLIHSLVSLLFTCSQYRLCAALALSICLLGKAEEAHIVPGGV